MNRINLNIPEDLHKRFKAICALKGDKMTGIVVRLIREYVEKTEKKMKP